MKKIALIIVFVICNQIFSQINFEKGYFINNSNEKVECLIKNTDWNNSPTFFEYKLNNSEEVKKGNIKYFTIFEIYNQVKYVRSIVKIDKSSPRVSELSTVRNPVFVEEELYLRELVSNGLKLFMYKDGEITRFFYQQNNEDITQLVYKPYLVDGKMAFNKYYINQLRKLLVCNSLKKESIEKVDYKEDQLIDIFTKYNQCINPNYVETKREGNKGRLNINIRPRINISSLTSINELAKTNTDFGTKMSFGIGSEFEYLLPYNKNKFGAFLELNYYTYKNEVTVDATSYVGNKLVSSVDYKSIDLPIGIRYYSFINDKSKVFFNLAYIFAFESNFDSKLEQKRIDGSIINSLKTNNLSNYTIGAGYNYNNKYGIEIRYFFESNITTSYAFQVTNLNNISIILSYNIL